MRVLVTGGAGFIGSHTCALLLEKGYEIIVLDSFSNSHEKSLQMVAKILKDKNRNSKISLGIVVGDIRNEETLEKLFFESSKIDQPIKAVLHFAGLKSVKESVLKPLLYWDVNVNGAMKLLRVMDRYNCKTIVFSSSATIYGVTNNTNTPLVESTEIRPVNPYGNTKASVEKLLNDIYKSDPKEWRIANLRYFNPIGAHPSGLIGEDPIGVPDNIFPYLTQVSAGNLEKVRIFGDNWPTSDGTGVRDYIHVMDLAEGHIASLEFLINDAPQIVNLNLGTGQGTSVLDLIKTFESVNQVKIPYEFALRRQGDIAKIIADNSLAISLLEWSPKRSLEQMCIDGWNWQSLNPNGYK